MNSNSNRKSNSKSTQNLNKLNSTSKLLITYPKQLAFRYNNINMHYHK